MDAYYAGPAGLGSYFDPDNPLPAEEPKMQQRNAEIAYNFAPQATINSRRMEKKSKYGEFTTPMDLTIQDEDLMIIAKSEGEVNMTLAVYEPKPTELSKLVEPDRSPFAVFNGLTKPELELDDELLRGDELYVSYRFIGVAETGGPKTYDPYRRIDCLTIIPDGVVNYINITGKPIEAGVPMTWYVASAPYTDTLLGHSNAFVSAPPNKRLEHDNMIYKAYFKPMDTANRTAFLKRFIQANYADAGMISAAIDIFDTKVVGTNMTRVGPGQRGQILLRPR